MAQLFTQPNSTLSGKLGDLVYYRRNGKTFIRTLPVKIKQSNSEKQIISQKRFSTLGKLFQIFRHALEGNLSDSLELLSILTPDENVHASIKSLFRFCKHRV